MTGNPSKSISPIRFTPLSWGRWGEKASSPSGVIHPGTPKTAPLALPPSPLPLSRIYPITSSFKKRIPSSRGRWEMERVVILENNPSSSPSQQPAALRLVPPRSRTTANSLNLPPPLPPLPGKSCPRRPAGSQVAKVFLPGYDPVFYVPLHIAHIEDLLGIYVHPSLRLSARMKGRIKIISGVDYLFNFC